MRVADFTLLVRVEGQPAAVRVFTDDEADEAAQYAARTGEWLCRCRFHHQLGTSYAEPMGLSYRRRRLALRHQREPGPVRVIRRGAVGPRRRARRDRRRR